MVQVRRLTSEDPQDPRYLVRLEPPELELLKETPGRLKSLLTDPERSPRIIDRLFPPAHKDDAHEEAEHRRLVGETLMEERLESLEAFEKTLDRARNPARRPEVELSEGELHLWIHVTNDVRVMLGTELDIQDNDWYLTGPARPEDLPSFVLLVFLSDIQERLIEALR